MQEESVSFAAPPGVFYNPHMRFCRSFASLAVGALDRDLKACDAFCASGIRGIRYAKENKNVKQIIFLDIDKRAIAAAKKNAKTNKLGASRASFAHGNISRLVFTIAADFAEIDPFGSPVPYLYDSFRLFNPMKEAVLSVTATDVAVTCGGKEKACLKSYHSKPLNNEFTHEIGMRILIKKIAETAAEFNMGIHPLASISHRHYQKTIISLQRSADAADASMRSLGYLNYCKNCGWRGSSQFPVPACPSCKKVIDYAGPLWLGELHDKQFLARMSALNRKRKYADRDALAKTISLMEGETNMPPFYYNIHQLCRLWGCKSVPKFDDLLVRIRKKGHKAVRTHFCNNSMKTDASLAEIRKAVR